jgi:hypothetical protein
MNTPAPRIEVGFGANSTFGDWFLLDDPIRGTLDDNIIAPGTVWVDVTDTALHQMSCRRGRDRFSDEPNGGTAQFTLSNRDRRYDPTVEFIAGEDIYGDIYVDLYAGRPAPYHGQLVPMRRVRISAVWEDGTALPVWSGYIDEWPVDYTNVHSEVQVPCVDVFAVLAGSELPETAPQHAGDLPRQRLQRVLNQVDFPPTWRADEGVEALGATSYGENALTYLKRLAVSDAGRLFPDAAGLLRFRDRTNLQTSPRVTLGTGIPIQHAKVDTSADQLWNVAVVTLEDGTEVTVENEVSKADYSPRTKTFDKLMLADTERAEAFGHMVIGRYGTPKLRVSQVVVRLAALTETQQRQVMALDIGDLVRVEFAPFSTGYPETLSRDGTVEGVSVQVSAGADWTVTLSMSATDAQPLLRLDDSWFGRLDTNLLAF